MPDLKTVVIAVRVAHLDFSELHRDAPVDPSVGQLVIDRSKFFGVRAVGRTVEFYH